MSKRTCTNRSSRRHQRGDALLESLVGMLILSIAVLGSLLAMANGVRTQHVNGVRAQVIDQLRDKLLQSGPALCGTTALLQVGTNRLNAVVTCTPYSSVAVGLPGTSPVTVTVPGAQAQIMTATVNSPILGGVLTVSSSQ